jgi:hypothetical protein
MSERSTTRPSENSAFDLRIDELVLHGFPPADRYEVASAIERELVRLLGESGTPPALIDGAGSEKGFAADQIDSGSFTLPRDAPPAAVGAEVARAIHRSLAGARAPDARALPGSMPARQQPGIVR